MHIQTGHWGKCETISSLINEEGNYVCIYDNEFSLNISIGELTNLISALSKVEAEMRAKICQIKAIECE